MGIPPANPATPSRTGDRVSSYSRYPCAVACIHVPINETTCPLNQRRKLGCCKEANVCEILAEDMVRNLIDYIISSNFISLNGVESSRDLTLD